MHVVRWKMYFLHNAEDFGLCNVGGKESLSSCRRKQMVHLLTAEKHLISVFFFLILVGSVCCGWIRSSRGFCQTSRSISAFASPLPPQSCRDFVCRTKDDYMETVTPPNNPTAQPHVAARRRRTLVSVLTESAQTASRASPSHCGSLYVSGPIRYDFTLSFLLMRTGLLTSLTL